MESNTILIVEDEKIIAEDIKKTLIKFKYNVTNIVASGEKAIQIVKKNRPDLILMDIMIEGKINGLEAAKQIYQEFGVPIVFLTAYSNDKFLKQASEASPFGYLIKPFEDRELHATIEMAFYKSKMETTLMKNRNFLWKVIDTVPNNIFVKDKNGKYLMANDSLAELYNTTPKEMIGKTDLELISKSKIKAEDLEYLIRDDLNVINGKKKIIVPEESLTL